MGKTNKWTKKEIEYLKKNYWGKDYLELARKLNKPYNAIPNKVYHLNLPRKKGKVKFSDKSRKKMSDTRKRLMKKGKIKPPLKFSETKAKELKRLYENGIKSGKIIKKMGVSYASISRYTKKRKDYKRKKQIEGFKKDLMKLSENEKGYIMGILDGEGSICIQTSNKKYCVASLNISNQDKEIIKYIHKKLNLWTKIYVSNKDKEKPCLAIRIFGKDMILVFLKFMLPYSHSNKTKKRGKIMLNFCVSKTQKARKKLYSKMRQNYHYKR